MLCDEWLVVLTSSSIKGLGWWECLSLYAMRFALSPRINLCLSKPFLSSETLRKRFGEVGCSGGTTQTWRHRLVMEALILSMKTLYSPYISIPQSPCSGCYGSNGSPSSSLQYLEDEVSKHSFHTAELY